MASNAFRFDEVWEIPEAPPEEILDVLADATLLPLWWDDVYKGRTTPRGEAGLRRYLAGQKAGRAWSPYPQD